MFSFLKMLVIAAVLAAVVAAGWTLWGRLHGESLINSYETCVKAGNKTQQGFVQTCITKEGKRFVPPPAVTAPQPPSEGMTPTP